MSEAPLLAVRDLCKVFRRRGRGFLTPAVETHAVDGVSFDIAEGETLGLVGESGCGKTTTGRMVVRLLEPSSGSITFNGAEISTLAGTGAARVAPAICRSFSRIPMSSLNPRMTAGELITEPLVVHSVGDRTARDKRLRAAARPRRAAAAPRRALSARVLRRAAPAHRHRARACARRRGFSSSTSRCRRSTSRSRRRSSTC